MTPAQANHLFPGVIGGAGPELMSVFCGLMAGCEDKDGLFATIAHLSQRQNLNEIFVLIRSARSIIENAPVSIEALHQEIRARYGSLEGFTPIR